MNNKEIIRQQILRMLFRRLQKPLFMIMMTTKAMTVMNLLSVVHFHCKLFSKEPGTLGLNMLYFSTFELFWGANFKLCNF